MKCPKCGTPLVYIEEEKVYHCHLCCYQISITALKPRRREEVETQKLQKEKS